MKIFSKIYRIAALIVIGAAFVIEATAIPARPDPQRLVNDYAGLFSLREADRLEKTLVAFDDTTSNQITVITVNDLEGYDAAEYATRIGIEWQVGSEQFDNGVVMLVKPKTMWSDGEIFIAVGYGLEGAIPDAYAKRIIDEIIIPFFRSGDYFGGVSAGCETLMKLASGEISELREDNGDIVPAIIFLIIVIGFILLIIVLADKNNKGGNHGTRGGRTVFIGPIFPRNSGGSSFGGGFGGGFGGFGGGSFGGGGAGGRW